MVKYYRNPHGESRFPGIYVQGLAAWTYDDGVRTRLQRRGRIPGALASSLEETTREVAVAQWLENRAMWRLPLPPSSPRGWELARTVALICSVAVVGMALAFFGSYLAVHEAMDGYDKRTTIGAIGLGIVFCGSGIWLMTTAERMTRSVIHRVRQARAPKDLVSE